MPLPSNKTKIVCTMGPASSSPRVIEQMLLAGMNIARLNFSHGAFEAHLESIKTLREASRKTGRRLSILADLPGPKMRIGKLAEGHITLSHGDAFTLTTENILGNAARVSMTFKPLPQVVKPGDTLFLNDGVVQVEVVRVESNDVHCKVTVGGELRSNKGLNLPGIHLGASAFTERDHECMKFALESGVDALSQSFVETADDIHTVRQAARKLGYEPFIIAKMERVDALHHADAILEAADGIMIARGDLGVELPIERIPVVQKQLMQKANLSGKPVITATQMLESMTDNPRPTRAEVNDVANAILDGTDCVMLSGESAVGRYPVEAVQMLAKVAEAIEPFQDKTPVREAILASASSGTLVDLIARSVERSVERVSAAAVMVPTLSGASARSITRFRLPVWIAALSPRSETCQRLQFSYGVHPIEGHDPQNWNAYVRKWHEDQGLGGEIVVLTGGPSQEHPEANYRMEMVNVGKR